LLLQKLEVSSGHDDEDDDDVAKVSKKLNIIPISELETMLEDMKQTKWYVHECRYCYCG
jgi:hypothetical protein